MTNKLAHTLFGYSKTEMRGKAVNMLMPPPVADVHTTYIRNYIQTGKASRICLWSLLSLNKRSGV
jgi:PAS domain S-box-containing protein